MTAPATKPARVGWSDLSCPDCNGSGAVFPFKYEPSKDFEPCPRCDGTGRYRPRCCVCHGPTDWGAVFCQRCTGDGTQDVTDAEMDRADPGLRRG